MAVEVEGGDNGGAVWAGGYVEIIGDFSADPDTSATDRGWVRGFDADGGIGDSGTFVADFEKKRRPVAPEPESAAACVADRVGAQFAGYQEQLVDEGGSGAKGDRRSWTSRDESFGDFR